MASRGEVLRPPGSSQRHLPLLREQPLFPSRALVFREVVVGRARVGAAGIVGHNQGVRRRVPDVAEPIAIVLLLLELLCPRDANFRRRLRRLLNTGLISQPSLGGDSGHPESASSFSRARMTRATSRPRRWKWSTPRPSETPAWTNCFAPKKSTSASPSSSREPIF